MFKEWRLKECNFVVDTYLIKIDSKNTSSSFYYCLQSFSPNVTFLTPLKSSENSWRMTDVFRGHWNETLERNGSRRCLLSDKYFVYLILNQYSTFVHPENTRKPETENRLKANVINCSENYLFNTSSGNFQ